VWVKTNSDGARGTPPDTLPLFKEVYF